MAQYSYIKAAGDLLVPATQDARDFLRAKKIGSILYADFKQTRNPAFHRKLFSLLNLGFDYWQPTGGTISPADKALVNGYVKFLAYYAGGEDALQAAANEYLADVADKRAGNISAAKSFEAFRAWVTIQAGFYTEFIMPDGTIRNEPKSISFAKMDDIEFGEFYKAVLDVLWNHILFRSFTSQSEVENVAAQLLEFAA
ncbi:DUF1367 family protein [Serratia ureilytica]